jgi:hypothetical protein
LPTLYFVVAQPFAPVALATVVIAADDAEPLAMRTLFRLCHFSRFGTLPTVPAVSTRRG